MVRVEVRPQVVVCTFGAQWRFRKIHDRELKNHGAFRKDRFHFAHECFIGRNLTSDKPPVVRRWSHWDLIDSDKATHSESEQNRRSVSEVSAAQPLRCKKKRYGEDDDTEATSGAKISDPK